MLRCFGCTQYVYIFLVPQYADAEVRAIGEVETIYDKGIYVLHAIFYVLFCCYNNMACLLMSLRPIYLLER